MKDSIKNVLWSGGWDSTFRVIQLYRLGATIQPVYVYDPSRISKKRELESLKRLDAAIPIKFKEAEGTILPLKKINRAEIPSNIFLKFICKVLKKRINLGKQYFWLATVAKQFKDLELSMHYEDMDRFFYREQLLKIEDEKLGVNWRINPKKVEFFKRHLFYNMTFPLITLTKPEMKSIAQENNFLDLMESTWFCNKSNQKPCAECTPCKQYIRDGFGYRVKN